MIKKAALVAAFAGIAAFVSPVAGHAQPENAGNVQLNADTAVLHGLKGTYQGDGNDIALGGCVAAGTDGLSSPKTARFTSPVLTFDHYDFGPLIGVPGNVTAEAKLKPGTKPGRYPLVLECEGKSYTTTFSVTKGQVAKVPSGAARAGDGSMAG
ncbi:hypothetical protein [Amycolatopsis sp. NPDC059657]|uniref:hypothetical protein n=1 Tax=Amycolatopsis sp. NPDC059657 TaxID=3346899 RepID=UPI00366F67E9